MAGVFTKEYFHDEAAAFSELESVVWPNGPVCPKCGATDRIGKLEGVKDKKGRVRLGLRKCYHCRQQFTCRVGTVFESSHIPLHLWLQASFLMMSSKKGISANQLHRTLGITLKSAWFVEHRLRMAMDQTNMGGLFGSGGGMVEVDETFIGNDPEKAHLPAKKGAHHKMKVLSLIDRSTGRARSFVVEDLKVKTIMPILQANIAREATLMTDEATRYAYMGSAFAGRLSVNHSAGEYVSASNPLLHTNTVESFFAVFKRGMRGIYQHCSKKHLHRYLAEFDFRYSYRAKAGFNDEARTEAMLRGIVGKRLTYRLPRSGCPQAEKSA
jgi:transposase-like protein